MKSKTDRIKKLAGSITILIILGTIFLPIIGGFVNTILILFGNIVDNILPIIDITEDYNSENNTGSPNEEILEQYYQWSYKKRWVANWKIPLELIDGSNNDLAKLENVIFKNQKYGEEEKYYSVLTNIHASVVEFWEAVYKQIRDDNEDRVEIISDIFFHAIKKNNLSDYDALNMILSFVQCIEYFIPYENYFQIYPPLKSIMINKGDCDTKSLLLCMIYEDLGYDTVLFYSDKYRHAMAGVSINSNGDHYEYYGKKYYFIETTEKGWQIGSLPEELSNKNFWYVINI